MEADYGGASYYCTLQEAEDELETRGGGGERRNWGRVGGELSVTYLSPALRQGSRARPIYGEASLNSHNQEVFYIGSSIGSSLSRLT